MANPDRNLGNIVFAAQSLWLIDHADALGGKKTELAALPEIGQHAFDNRLADMIQEAFTPQACAGHLKRVQTWLAESAAALDIEDAISATGVRRWNTKTDRRRLVDFVRGRLLITHSLLCNRLGHPQLNLSSTA